MNRFASWKGSGVTTSTRCAVAMGLSINRSIVERHGGQLWGTANSDRGATIQLALPGTP